MYHEPVLLNECLEGLAIRPNGTYVDATFGGGGHSSAILERLNDNGRLIAFDQDKDAAEQILSDNRLVFVRQNFRHIRAYLKLNKAIPVDGILADLGVSSHQIDTPEKGFSSRFDGPLDMRMDPDNGLTAARIVNEYEESELVRVFSGYGEVSNSKTLAARLVEARGTAIETTGQLKEAIDHIIRGNRNRYLAQVFQALRIEVNDEMGALRDLLEQGADVLAPGGRMVVMSYHSLEDRLVKNYFRAGVFSGEPEKDMFGNYSTPFKLVSRKVIEATDQEVGRNPRARSAKLRIAEKA